MHASNNQFNNSKILIIIYIAFFAKLSQICDGYNFNLAQPATQPYNYEGDRIEHYLGNKSCKSI